MSRAGKGQYSICGVAISEGAKSNNIGKAITSPQPLRFEEHLQWLASKAQIWEANDARRWLGNAFVNACLCGCGFVKSYNMSVLQGKTKSAWNISICSGQPFDAIHTCGDEVAKKFPAGAGWQQRHSETEKHPLHLPRRQTSGRLTLVEFPNLFFFLHSQMLVFCELEEKGQLSTTFCLDD